MDTIKLLVEDEEFFLTNITAIQQNDYPMSEVKIALGLLKDYWDEGIHLTYDGIIERGLMFLKNDIDKEELVELVNVLREKNLSERRIAEVKEGHKYWRLFVLILKATNHLRDSCFDTGLPQYNHLVEIGKRAIEDVKKVEEELRLIDDTSRLNSRKNDW